MISYSQVTPSLKLDESTNQKRPKPFHASSPTARLLSFFPSSQPQALPNIRLDPTLKLRPPLPPHPSRIHIRRALIVRLGDHAHHADENLLDALDRAPALRGLLVVVRVVAGRVQDGDANDAVGVDYKESTKKHNVSATVSHYLSLSLSQVPSINQGDPLPFGCQMSHWNFMVGGMRG